MNRHSYWSDQLGQAQTSAFAPVTAYPKGTTTIAMAAATCRERQVTRAASVPSARPLSREMMDMARFSGGRPYPSPSAAPLTSTRAQRIPAVPSGTNRLSLPKGHTAGNAGFSRHSPPQAGGGKDPDVQAAPPST